MKLGQINLTLLWNKKINSITHRSKAVLNLCFVSFLCLHMFYLHSYYFNLLVLCLHMFYFHQVILFHCLGVVLFDELSVVFVSNKLKIALKLGQINLTLLWNKKINSNTHRSTAVLTSCFVSFLCLHMFYFHDYYFIILVLCLNMFHLHQVKLFHRFWFCVV